MALEAKNILLGLVVKAYNLTNEEAAEYLNDAEDKKTDGEVISALLELNKNKVKETKAKAFDDGHKKATGEALTNFEKSIREEYGVTDTSLKGADLIKSVVQTKAKTESGNETPLTDDAVKKHPLYIQLQDQSKQAIKKATDDATAKVAELETGYKRKDTLNTVKEEAGKLFDSLNPVLPADAKVAANQRRLFIESVISGKNYEKQGDRWVIMGEDGKVMEDEHGHAMLLSDYVKSNASENFEFKKTGVGGNSGNQNSAGGSPNGKHQFKNEAAFMAYVSDYTNSLEDRTAASDAWTAAQTAAAGAE